jgi:hypothetical protein
VTALRAPAPWQARARFLFRSEDGVVDAPTWRFHVVWLALLLTGLTAGWLVLRPLTRHDLATSAFIAPGTVAAFTYLVLYAFAVLLVAVSYTMLSIKRLRARALPTGLAGLVPLLSLLAASLHFLHAQTPDVVGLPYVVLLDGALLAAVGWTAVELGARTDRP